MKTIKLALMAAIIAIGQTFVIPAFARKAKAILFAVMLAFTANAQAEWRHWKTTDELSGKSQWYASAGGFVKPTKPLSLPYEDLEASFVVSCTKKNGWSEPGTQQVYVALSSNAVISNARISSSKYSTTPSFENRIKWGDDKVSTQEYSKERSVPFIHLTGSGLNAYYDDDIIAKIRENDSVFMEFAIYGQWHLTRFRFDLRGAGEHIDAIRANCL